MLALLFAWVAFSVVWSEISYLTEVQSGIVGAAIAGYVLIRLVVDGAAVRNRLATAMVSLGLVLALAMFLQIALGHRPEGPFLNINSAGAFLNLLWPLPAAAALLLPRKSALALTSLGITGVMVFAAGLTGGRAVTLALIAAFIAVVVGSRAWARRRRLAAVTAIVLCALVLAQVTSQAMPAGESRNLGNRMATLSEPGTAGESRLRIWEGTWAMIQERPWLGWGPGTFFQAYPAYRSPDDGSAGQHAHNDYLQYWAEGGLPALALLLALFGVCGYRFVRSATRPPVGEAERVMVLAGGAAIAGAAVHALFSYNLQLLPMLIVLGLAVGALEAGSGAPAWLRIPIEPVRRRPLVALSFALLLAIPVTHLGTVAASAHYTQRGSEAMAGGELQRAEDAFSTAARLWPAQGLARGFWADLYRQALESLPAREVERRRALKQRGLELVAEAASRNPLRPLHALTRGRLLLQAPGADLEAAERAFGHALELNPRTAAARVALTRLLVDQGRDEEALAIVNAGFGPTYSERNNPAELLRLGVRLREGAGDHAGAVRLRDQLDAMQARAASRSSNPPGAAEYGL
ncbi:MAG: O-antigen ligase family protein [Halofilum sp. (in: g-proteobacteria)]